MLWASRHITLERTIIEDQSLALNWAKCQISGLSDFKTPISFPPLLYTKVCTLSLSFEWGGLFRIIGSS